MPYPDIRKAAQLIERDRSSEAVEMLLRVRSSAPSYVTPRILLARAFTSLGNTTEAARMWSEARALLPGNMKLAEEAVFRPEIAEARAAGAAGLKEPPPAEPNEDADSLRSSDTTEPDQNLSEKRDERPEGLPYFLSDADADEPDSIREESTDIRSTAGDVFRLDSLDDLIDQLENAPRITPRPGGHSPEVDDLSADADDEEEIVSETLARIYVTQQQYNDAARVYEQLAKQHPDRSEEFLTMARKCLENAED